MKNFQNYSPGHDDLCISSYKENFDYLGETLLSICNKSLFRGIFPLQLKITKTTPVFNKGDEKENSNYQLIWALSSISKTIKETVVK